MLWGPPGALMKRTVVPGAMVRGAGLNAAWVEPLPVIWTSTTGPEGAALVVGVVAAGFWVAVSAGFLSPPHATAPSATRVANAVNRIALPPEGFSGSL